MHYLTTNISMFCRKTRNLSLSESKSYMKTPKRQIQKELKHEVKSPDDQQAIDALLTLAHAVRTPKFCIDDIIQVSEDQTKSLVSTPTAVPVVDTFIKQEPEVYQPKKVVKVEKIELPIAATDVVKKEEVKKEADVEPALKTEVTIKQEVTVETSTPTNAVVEVEKNAKSPKESELPLKDISVKVEKSSKVVKEPKNVKSVQLMSAPPLPTSVKRRRSRHSNELISHVCTLHLFS